MGERHRFQRGRDAGPPVAPPRLARTETGSPRPVILTKVPPKQVASRQCGKNLSPVGPETDVSPDLEIEAPAFVDDASQKGIVEATHDPGQDRKGRLGYVKIVP